MVYQHIKVYARLKKELKDKSLVLYEITKKKKDYEDLLFCPTTNCAFNSCCGFRFYKIFDVKSLQAEIFEVVAKPVINSVIEGFNGTIFAYGQTGSGKTHSITGSSKNYNERGIIPRSIQYIFEHYENVAEKPSIYISYMEIYNEVGYDLLSTKQSKLTRILDELPRVTLLEDKKGNANIRNLNVCPVASEQEAMRLLFLGDTNRTIAETVSNEFSSRSHCIFTIYINLRDINSANLRSSKLHIVDLAGSERISKTLSKGSCLQEAKSINLSLHFLQQVILALSESNRTHIPYRNSMLTHILKDSLNGNCITSMLATLSTSQFNIEESLSTCRFAQKVSMITTDPIINVLDPQKEIHFLKLKIEDLEKRLSLSTSFTNSKSLSKRKMEEYANEVKSFIASDKKSIMVEPDMTEIQFCFSLLKNEIESKKTECMELENSLVKKTEGMSVLNDELLKKDKEIIQLKNIIDRIPERPVPLSSCDEQTTSASSSINTLSNQKQHSSVEEEKLLCEMFMSQPEVSKDLNFYKKALEKQYSQAKLCADTIEKCQKQINFIKEQLDTPLSWVERNRLMPELEKEQALYKKTLLEIKNIQSQTVHLQCGLKGEEVKCQRKFNYWLQEYNKNTNLYPMSDDHKLSENYYSCKQKEFNEVSGKLDSYKFVDYNFFDNNENSEDINNIKTSNKSSDKFSLKNLDKYLNMQYDSNSEMNDISLTSINDDVYKFDYSTLVPKNLVSNKDSTTENDISKDSIASITTKSGCTSNDDLLNLLSTDEEKEILENCRYKIEQAEKDVDTFNGLEKYFIKTDTLEFKEFMKTVAVTGIDEIDYEIFGFYRSKFC